MTIILFSLLIFLLILPFVPGVRELWRKEDAAPLYINMESHREPRYFGLAFRKMLKRSLAGYAGARGVFSISLSKQEQIEVVDTAAIGDNSNIKNIYYVEKTLQTGSKVVFEKEIYACGDVIIGENNRLRALACDGDIRILQGTKFTRWLDAEGNIRVDEQCSLGVSAACGQELSISRQCLFKRLYGFPVVTLPCLDAGKPVTEKGESFQTDGVRQDEPERNLSIVPAHSRQHCDFIAAHSLIIGEYAIIDGHIKTHGDLTAAPEVTILGNIFAEGNIRIGPHCKVLGTIFTQGHILLEKGVTIGTYYTVKSVISKKGITLHSGVKIFGFVSTDGEGRVV
ncbi:hypothetical protein [Sporomusa aerivorans]|uniref:hypothetical protein n=1 Tax=Sporomusa aerivorans TaxID=204936 RepID=UPI00352AEDF6